MYYAILNSTKQEAPLTGAALWNAKVGTLGYTQVSAGNLTALTTLYDALVTAGIDTKLDFMYIFAQDGSEGAGWVNFVDPDNYTIIQGGNIVWTNDAGITTSATNSNYYATGFTPSTASGNMTQNSTTIGVYADGAGITDKVPYMGGITGTYDLAIHNYRQSTTKRLYLSNNRGSIQPDTYSSTLPYSNHMMTMSITGSAAADTDYYANATNIGNPTLGTVGLADSEIWIGFINNAALATVSGTAQLAIAFGGSGLTATEVSDLYDAINTYVGTTSF